MTSQARSASRPIRSTSDSAASVGRPRPTPGPNSGVPSTGPSMASEPPIPWPRVTGRTVERPVPTGTVYWFRSCQVRKTVLCILVTNILVHICEVTTSPYARCCRSPRHAVVLHRPRVRRPLPRPLPTPTWRLGAGPSRLLSPSRLRRSHSISVTRGRSPQVRTDGTHTPARHRLARPTPTFPGPWASDGRPSRATGPGSAFI